MACAVLLDGVDLVELVFAEAVGGERADSESERENGRDRDGNDFRARPRERSAGSILPGCCARPSKREGFHDKRSERQTAIQSWGRDRALTIDRRFSQFWGCGSGSTRESAERRLCSNTHFAHSHAGRSRPWNEHATQQSSKQTDFLASRPLRPLACTLPMRTEDASHALRERVGVCLGKQGGVRGNMSQKTDQLLMGRLLTDED